MKRKTPFCSDGSRNMCEDYYVNEAGDGMPVFIGGGYQHGMDMA